jgi:hypothetical protein
MIGRCSRSDLRLRSIIAMEAVTGREQGGATGRSDLTLAVRPVIPRKEEAGHIRSSRAEKKQGGFTTGP